MCSDAKIEYLKMIQTVIDRMSRFGFLVKAWGVSLVTAIVVLAVDKSQPDLLLIALMPLFAFWFLDAFFLHTETKYRALYNVARNLSNDDEIDFDLNPNSEKINDSIKIRFQVFFSVTFLAFWGAMAGVVMVSLLAF